MRPARRSRRDMDRPARPSADAPLPAALRTLAARGVPRSYGKGMMLIHEGDRDDTLYIITSGRVKAFSRDDRGREIVYGVYGAGDYFGEMSLDGGPRSASVCALEPTSCIAITRLTLREHIVANPEFAFELLDRVIHRARAATRTARDMALLDVYGRVTRLLDELAVAREDGTRVIDGGLTHREIASRVGCSREMVSRLMKDLETGKFIAPRGSETEILRPFPSGW
jgi:CRP/FNR family transcriptional regulator, cyclic AMP receptor protein